MVRNLFCETDAQYESLEINFKEHLYVPELTRPVLTSMKEKTVNHLQKCIAACTRNHINLRYFTKAQNDPTTGLTYTAVNGQHKQFLFSAIA